MVRNQSVQSQTRIKHQILCVCKTTVADRSTPKDERELAMDNHNGRTQGQVLNTNGGWKEQHFPKHSYCCCCCSIHTSYPANLLSFLEILNPALDAHDYRSDGRCCACSTIFDFRVGDLVLRRVSRRTKFGRGRLFASWYFQVRPDSPSLTNAGGVFFGASKYSSLRESNCFCQRAVKDYVRGQMAVSTITNVPIPAPKLERFHPIHHGPKVVAGWISYRSTIL